MLTHKKTNIELLVIRLWLMHMYSTQQRHNTENSKQIFPEKELRGYSPNSYI